MPVDHLNIWVAGVPMCSIAIKTDKQKAIFDKIGQGEFEGEVFIAKMKEEIVTPKGVIARV